MLSFNASSTPSISRAEQVLMGLPQPLVVVLQDRRIVFANPDAERLFAEGQACRMAERLMGLGQLKANKIEDLLRLAAAGQPAQAGLWFSQGMRTGWLDVSGVTGWLSRGAEWPAGCLLLLLHLDAPALTQEARIDAICQQCRLTATERYVLMLLADGLQVEAVARQLELQVSTLRSHVRNLLSKTQAPSLMQLVRWVGSSDFPCN